MKRLLGALVLLAGALPASAPAVPCSPLSCAPSQYTLASGTLLAFRGTASGAVRVIDLRSGRTRWRLPGGAVGGHALVHQDGSLVTWYDLVTGARTGDAVLQAHAPFVLVGASQDGSRAVLARTQHRSTTFTVVSRTAQRAIALPGNRWSFDALRGDDLYLLRQVARGYEVRLVHVASAALVARPLKDPNESSVISGTAWTRVASADGRFVFTLYVDSDGSAMVHVLDTLRATARCIDLPGKGDTSAAMTYALVVDPDGRHLWAVSPGYQRVVHIDLVPRRVVDAYSFVAGSWNTVPSIAVLAPDGERIAVTDSTRVWFVELAQRKVVQGPAHVAVALGWSPDERHLWAIGERSRVSSLPLR